MKSRIRCPNVNKRKEYVRCNVTPFRESIPSEKESYLIECCAQSRKMNLAG